MTSAKSMHRGNGWMSVALHPAVRWVVIWAVVATGSMLVGGCTTLTMPTEIDAGNRASLWGVAPFRNESGVSLVDGARVADVLMMEAQQVHGVDVVPVNRVIFAMRDLGIDSVTSHADAMSLMSVLQLDGLIVGTVTAYQPYRPMVLGMATQLYVRTPDDDRRGLDSRKLTASTGGHASPEDRPPGPVSQSAGVFDAANHRTLAWLEQFAAGRAEPDSAYGREIYQVSMDLYTHFVCYRLLDELIAREAQRQQLAHEPN